MGNVVTTFLLTSLFGGLQEFQPTATQEYSQENAISGGYIAVACLPDNIKTSISIGEAYRRFVEKGIRKEQRVSYETSISASIYEKVFNDIQDNSLIVVARDHKIKISDFMSLNGLTSVNVYVVVDTHRFRQLYLINVGKGRLIRLLGSQGFIAEYREAQGISVGHGDVLVFRANRKQEQQRRA